MYYEILQQYNLFYFRKVEQELQEARNLISSVHNLNGPILEKLVDLVAITAAEFSISGFEKVPPLFIEPADVLRAVVKTDTIITDLCESKERLSKNEILLSDLFLFTADLQKAESIQDINTQALNEFYNSFENFANEFVNAQIRNDLYKHVSSSLKRLELVLKVQTVIWNLRLGLLLGLDEEENKENTNNLMKGLGIQNLMW